MPRFASETTVPVERSRAEIVATLIRYGADEFQTGWKEGAAMIAFKLRSLFVRFILPIPKRDEKRFTHKPPRNGYQEKRTERQAEAVHQQEVRQRWRALLLTIKAKLEAVESGISTVEQEFLAFIVLPNQLTVGEWMSEAMPEIAAGQMPRLLTAPRPEKIEDAEFEEK
jgi:hypothetical protein